MLSVYLQFIFFMIKNFRHKGLEELFLTGQSRKINNQHKKKLILQLSFLNALISEEELLMVPNWRPHKLTGKNNHGQDLNGHWSFTVSGNWRLTFYFDQKDKTVVLLDYIDYH